MEKDMRKIKIYAILTAILLSTFTMKADKLFIPMDLAQTDHLKAYGITYWYLKEGGWGDWLLNYRSGSFVFDYSEKLAIECRLRGVDFEVMSDGKVSSIYTEVQDENVNMDVVRLEKAPKIAVYAPPGAQPWDDAVRMVLEYAEIDHDIIWDEEVLDGKLKDYDWLHLHHEDFTGQYGKFWRNYARAPWYISQVSNNDNMANRLGYKKVSVMKRDVALSIREFIAGGGFLFAMCSATDSYDIALAAAGTDICSEMFDGDPCDKSANQHLNYENTLAFKDFKVILDPNIYEFSDIDIDAQQARATKDSDYFTLFDFSAKYDPVPTMLTQCHANVIPGFMGQTTAFHKEFIKNSVIVLGEREGTDQVKYIHGKFGSGFFTWYGGHDPEDYTHYIGDPPTDVSLHKNSPGYRLILNNILFPAAKKKQQKT
jgi:hypothetical protein